MHSRLKQRTTFSPEEIAKHAPRLDPKFAAVLALADALSYEGIAADLNISLGTVKSRLYRARAQLARFIEEDANANEGNA